MHLVGFIIRNVVIRLGAGQPRSRGSIPGGGKRFFSLQSVHTGSGVHPASYSKGTEALSPGLKRPWLKALSKVEWSFTSPPLYASMACTVYPLL